MPKKTQLLFSNEGGDADVSDQAASCLDEGKPTSWMLERRETARRCGTCGGVFSGVERFCPFDGEPLIAAPTYDPQADPLIGKTVGERYRVEEVIAEGGMGTVYRVRHTLLHSAFAMKVLRRDIATDPTIAGRLIHEARATASIGHPNIVAAADFGEIDASVLPGLGKLKLPYFVMEHLAGYTLAELLAEVGALTPRRTAHIVEQLASALAAAHRGGIIHRDLKPDNIRLVRDESGGEIAKVVDFGVAKVIGASRQTRNGIVFGTPHYMSPEQGRGEPIDERTDIYALGVIIYECLTGEVPFVGDSVVGIITQHIHAVPPSLARSLEKAPIARVMRRCLEKYPEERYESMTELGHELEGAPRRRSRISTHGGSVMRIAGERRRAIWPWLAAAFVGLGGAAIALSESSVETVPSAAGGAVSSSAPRVVGARPEASRSGALATPSSASVPATSATVSSALPRPSSEPKPPNVDRPGARPTPTHSPRGDVVDPWG